MELDLKNSDVDLDPQYARPAWWIWICIEEDPDLSSKMLKIVQNAAKSAKNWRRKKEKFKFLIYGILSTQNSVNTGTIEPFLYFSNNLHSRTFFYSGNFEPEQYSDPYFKKQYGYCTS